MTEAELFQPIKAYFELQGYTIDGEVGDIDMLMKKDDEYIVIELKTDLNFKLFIQGAKRQKMFNQVYLAVWSPKNMRSKAFRDKVYLLNRLGLGLIIVTKRGKNVIIYSEPVMHPIENYKKNNNKAKNKLLKEMNGRRTRTNIGGVRGKKLMTAYKEDCLIILDLLYHEKRMKASLIKKTTGISTSYNKVYNNHYGWFAKEEKGIYTLSENGKKAYEEHIELINKIKESINLKLNDK